MKFPNHVLKLAAVGALVMVPTVAQANPSQSSSQSISSSTMASGPGAVATSHTSQSIYQSAATPAPYGQMVIQAADVNTAAVGNQAVAATQLNQSATQTHWGTGPAWADEYTQMMLQQATLGNYALGDWSQAITDIEQISEQYSGGY
jgi:hypothetical protein